MKNNRKKANTESKTMTGIKQNKRTIKQKNYTHTYIYKTNKQKRPQKGDTRDMNAKKEPM